MFAVNTIMANVLKWIWSLWEMNCSILYSVWLQQPPPKFRSVSELYPNYPNFLWFVIQVWKSHENRCSRSFSLTSCLIVRARFPQKSLHTYEVWMPEAWGRVFPFKLKLVTPFIQLRFFLRTQSSVALLSLDAAPILVASSQFLLWPLPNLNASSSFGISQALNSHDKYAPSTFYVPNTVICTGFTAVNKAGKSKVLLSWKSLIVGLTYKQKINGNIE